MHLKDNIAMHTPLRLGSSRQYLGHSKVLIMFLPAFYSYIVANYSLLQKRSDDQMDSSHPVLHGRPPKSKKQQRKDSNPDPFTIQNSTAADVIHLCILKPPKSPTPTSRTSRKPKSVNVLPHTKGSGLMLKSATHNVYLLAIEDAIDSLILAFDIHCTQHPEPTEEPLHEHKLMDTACISPHKITKNPVGNDPEEPVWKWDEPYRKARYYTDSSTATTQETVSLADRIQVIQHKLDHLP
ncbi:hypothetical protein B9Z19DRAFT_1069776 [Tuber borchii]|uniref:Uncharacterized protein n=1 Tax=Tuber borchii TaxID=42251 RepID=A0A2T6ZA97_TUBBO|nr:hypothetical protein B9Z19DRAFT_1069776 [Tuber borchii]